MERIIDINEYQIREQADSSRAFLRIKPFTAHHTQLIKTIFKNYSDLSYWCGYTFIENVPVSLENEIIPISTNERTGVVLFLNTSETLHLLFQDVQDNFHLITESGQTISIKKNLEELLIILRRRAN
ncbi:MAG: hypothetical protein JKY12_01990 [Sneathiella sp.]|nr:hypothetical protein [Sneathiella sp.]